MLRNRNNTDGVNKLTYLLYACIHCTDHEGFPRGLKTDFTLPKEEEEEEEDGGLPKSKL